MKIPRSAIAKTVEVLLVTEARKATLFLDDKTVVTAARRFKPNKRERFTEVSLKLGAPNAKEREFIRICKKAGEPLPVRKVQLKHWPKRK